MQAKDNRLLLATIGWSKEKHTTHLPEGHLEKAMIRCFCLSAKAMHLWRDVCLWHVEEYICHHEALPSVITYEVLNVIARSKATWQSPGRAPYYKTHARYCIMGPNGILCTRGEKSQTSKRVNIIAPIMRFQKCSARRSEG